ncbi:MULTISPECIES: AAA family ATPase [Metabacillus]|uniref:AAA family ATPase n=1 Tax=Metabacillus rhizolycopersici TaxID=2875709 RepID=A0ABS7USN2_9BACI|nr:MULTISPECIES: AAA family ATPase [Metabacillus]MBZ5751310.1 AAA family ATPase [Metabacillus rhizolycopersici]MCM3654109.1 AAA family ATPase [Metabacillus litoralis]
MRNNPVFIETKEYKRFAEFCDSCAKYKYIGICQGPPGVGKTISARHYANWDYVYEKITESKAFADQGQNIEDDRILTCHTIFYTAPVMRPSQIYVQINKLAEYLQYGKDGYVAKRDNLENDWIKSFKKGRRYEAVNLLIVDEVDRLKLQTLEIIRDIYDQHSIGMVLIGMPGIEKRLSRYPQLYSRVGFIHEFKKLTPTEMKYILEFKWQELGTSIKYESFSDYEAFNTIIKITGGNFRLIQRLFSQIERIMEINRLEKITTEVIETARDILVIGSND